MKTPKNKNSIRDSVGFTQEELAMLLGVTRSMLAKFELGLGSLPNPAKLLLAELLVMLEGIFHGVGPQLELAQQIRQLADQGAATPNRFCITGLVVVYCRNCFFSG